MGGTCCQNNQHSLPLNEFIQLTDFITECQPKEQEMGGSEKLEREKKWRSMTLRAKKKAIEVIGKGSRVLNKSHTVGTCDRHKNLTNARYNYVHSRYMEIRKKDELVKNVAQKSNNNEIVRRPDKNSLAKKRKTAFFMKPVEEKNTKKLPQCSSKLVLKLSVLIAKAKYKEFPCIFCNNIVC
eukprot:TRINITY_DN5358_c0_g4_i1.p1 TRINITY_DN5358_c0_g4~~TRINITY_DN5358_c0_g4_i1.p1  ORF type:complete len:182 (-),score=42.09 TRINITY_DN5358_c0_g4_i1:108-653(-)